MSLTTASTDTFRVDTVQHETGLSLASLCLSIRFVGNIQSQLQNPPTFIVSKFFCIIFRPSHKFSATETLYSYT
jgi:hypothetical protein